jgi:TRAP-type C4-dicarboxylate transport system permease small subunit
VSHGYEAVEAPRAKAPALPGPIGVLDRATNTVNACAMALGGIALIIASLVLTYSVVVRYVLRIPTDWQDETAVFLIVGTVFCCAAAVQARRGHVGIEAIAVLLSERANHIRMIVVDVLSFLFCTFFAWKSWTLLHEAMVDDQHSSSTWAPPLWIPYSLMAAGMTFLAAQILLQVVHGFAGRRGSRR